MSKYHNHFNLGKRSSALLPYSLLKQQSQNLTARMLWYHGKVIERYWTCVLKNEHMHTFSGPQSFRLRSSIKEWSNSPYPKGTRMAETSTLEDGETLWNVNGSLAQLVLWHNTQRGDLQPAKWIPFVLRNPCAHDKSNDINRMFQESIVDSYIYIYIILYPPTPAICRGSAPEKKWLGCHRLWLHSGGSSLAATASRRLCRMHSGGSSLASTASRRLCRRFLAACWALSKNFSRGFRKRR